MPPRTSSQYQLYVFCNQYNQGETPHRPSSIPSPLCSLHPHFHTHLICPNKCFPILHCEMSMVLGELETTLPVKFLEKGSMSGYSMIVAEVLESMFELGNANIKLEVLNDRHSG